MERVYTFKLEINWALMNAVSMIDRFDASWVAIERKEGAGLKELKSIATVKSVGASTRIEGSKLTDAEVDILLKSLDISKLEDRDKQEVAGYFETLDLIADQFEVIEITENNIKNLHNMQLKYSKKDEWHKGDYKLHSNAVEATLTDGTKQIIFHTTEPGFQTEDAVRNLIDWYNMDITTHPLVKCAVFTYEFLSIHPFQDGNGRLSRLISTLLLLKNGYNWIQFVSFEHEIEKRKMEYYSVLKSCQSQRPNEIINDWVLFFLDALKNIQIQLMHKLVISGIETQLSPREKTILSLIENNPGCSSGDIAQRLGIPNSTVKRILKELVEKGLIAKYGVGPSTNYSIK